MGNSPLGAQSSNIPLPGGAVENESLTLAELAQSLKNFLVPTGSVLPFAGGTAPSGFLICNGSAVSRNTYADLYAVLGGASSPYGQGDGSNTFNLPNLAGRVTVGAGTGAQNGGVGSGVISGGAALTARSRGQFEGDERLQTHTHTGTTGNESQGHTHGGTTNGASTDHSHALPQIVTTNAGSTTGLVYQGSRQAAGGLSTGGHNVDHTHTFTTAGVSANHTHSFTSASHNQPNGTGQNMPPFVVVNYIIKF